MEIDEKTAEWKSEYQDETCYLFAPNMQTEIRQKAGEIRGNQSDAERWNISDLRHRSLLMFRCRSPSICVSF
jgi:hypothetical protein